LPISDLLSLLILTPSLELSTELFPTLNDSDNKWIFLKKSKIYKLLSFVKSTFMRNVYFNFNKFRKFSFSFH
jgi:hypothetical protein